MEKKLSKLKKIILNKNKFSLFESLVWRDPVTGNLLEPLVEARTPAGVPINGVMRIKGTDRGYPIVDSVIRLTPELANKHRKWLQIYSLKPPVLEKKRPGFQQIETVDSFGWQWTWNSMMRTKNDLKMRVLNKFRVKSSIFSGQFVLDAGAGAGDQSQYMLALGAKVVSVDLSSSIDIVARKLRMNPLWIGVQADIMSLPFIEEQFDVIYCEGVIQHTQDSVKTVKELCRVLKGSGTILAAHYVSEPPKTLIGRIKRKFTTRYYKLLRGKLSRMERFRLLFMTGLFAALNYVPLVGFLLRKTGTVIYYDLMPDFKTTWTNTFDYYGNHSYQRIIAPEDFYNYFESAGGIKLVFKQEGNVVAKKDCKQIER